MQSHFPSELEALMQGLFAPDMPSLQASDLFEIGDLDHRVGNHVVLNIHSIFWRPGGDFPQDGTLRWDDGAFALVELCGEEPKLAMVHVKLAARFANAALAKDEDLFALP